MLIYPDIDPIAFSVGNFKVHWYGITYLFGFLGAFLVMCLRGPSRPNPWNAGQISDVIFYAAIGIILGGRFGFILFYQPTEILNNPLTLLAFWEPGRSFHGGFLGVLFSLMVFSKLQKRPFLEITDFIAPVVPIGLGFGRLGNFINGELWGRITEVPWGMVFPHVGPEPRHPSQLYEFVLEGVLMFIILMAYSRKPRALGAVSGLFLLCYGLFRCLVELVREPDASHGFVAFQWLTMGQMLSIPMIVLGLYFLFFTNSQKNRS